jgi:hypothetical protein
MFCICSNASTAKYLLWYSMTFESIHYYTDGGPLFCLAPLLMVEETVVSREPTTYTCHKSLTNLQIVVLK